MLLETEFNSTNQDIEFNGSLTPDLVTVSYGIPSPINTLASYS